MLRFLAGAAACFLMMTGAFLIWQSRAHTTDSLPPAPQLQGTPSISSPTPLQAPEATPKSREERRFARAEVIFPLQVLRIVAMASQAFVGQDRPYLPKLDGGDGALRRICRFFAMRRRGGDQERR